MARTKQEILSALENELEKYPALKDMSNPNYATAFNSLLQLLTDTISLQETYNDNTVILAKATRLNQRLGDQEFYLYKIKQFRIRAQNPSLDYNLVYNEQYIPSFSDVVLALPQFLTKISLVPEGSAVDIKVLKSGDNILEEDEKQALLDYINALKVVGTTIQIQSEPPCKISLGTATTDIKTYIKVNTGFFKNKEQVLTKLHDTLSLFFTDYAFDTQLYLDLVTDALQKEEGFLNIRIDGLLFKQNLQDDYSEFTDLELTSTTGHFTYSPITLEQIGNNLEIQGLPSE